MYLKLTWTSRDRTEIIELVGESLAFDVNLYRGRDMKRGENCLVGLMRINGLRINESCGATYGKRQWHKSCDSRSK
jgi:hypothetical protein